MLKTIGMDGAINEKLLYNGLLPYQIEAVQFLAKRKRFRLLADEMGLGKTVSAIRGLDSIHAKTALIVCPSVARIQWAREFKKWQLIKRDIKVLEKLSDRPIEGINICSFEYASKNNIFKKDVLIIDECHFVKNYKARRTKALIGARGLVHKMDRTWFLSGTPLPNHAGEGWLLLYLSGQTKLDYNSFVKKYCNVLAQRLKGRSHFVITGTKKEMVPELKELFKPIMLRRLKKDVMKDLPPITYRKIPVVPGDVDFEIHAEFARYFVPVPKILDLKADLTKQADKLRMAWDTQEVADRLQVLQGLQNSISTLRQYIGCQKIDPATELIKEALIQGGNNLKVVVFAIHRSVIDSLYYNLRIFNPVRIYGGITPQMRQSNLDAFQNDKKTRIAICQIIAAGTAINLTRAHTIFFVEQDFVPGNNAQAVMRCHRIGQENPVFVNNIVINNSLDERISDILTTKTEILTSLFGTS